MARPSHQPDAGTQRQVEAMAAYGIPEAEIAAVFKIDPETLRKHFRDELDLGHTKANAQVAGFLFNAAKSGNVTAQISWLKTRARWKEGPAEHLHSGAVGTYDLSKLTDVELDASLASSIRLPSPHEIALEIARRVCAAPPQSADSGIGPGADRLGGHVVRVSNPPTAREKLQLAAARLFAIVPHACRTTDEWLQQYASRARS